MTIKPTNEMRAALKAHTCCDCGHEEALADLLAVVEQGRDDERLPVVAIGMAIDDGLAQQLNAAMGELVVRRAQARIAEEA